MNNDNRIPPVEPAKASSGAAVKRALIVILAVLVLILLIQNIHVVTVKFLFWRISMSLALLFPLMLLIGLIMGMLIQFLVARKK